LQYGNPGNPYAAYSPSYNAAAGWISSTGTSLINATIFGQPNSGATINGNADSSGQFTQVTLLVGGYGRTAVIRPVVRCHPEWHTFLPPAGIRRTQWRRLE
jgi:hypothetical protein